MLTRRLFLRGSLVTVLLVAGCTEEDSPTTHVTESLPDDSAKTYARPDLPKIDVNVPLLDALWKLDPEIQEQFPGDFDHGLWAVGIGFARPNELTHGGYYCTPGNSVAFAWTGGDGEHFSFIVRNNTVDADSPVILTAPSNSGNENHLIAENFQSFLRLGLRRGFFGLSHFAYDPEGALAAYKPDWKPATKSHSSIFVPDNRQRKILDFVAESLELEPLNYTSEQYKKLQARLDEMLDTEFE